MSSLKIAEIPFDSNRKMMSVSTKHHLYSKGAPDVLLKKCDTLLLNGKKIALSSMQKEHILKTKLRSCKSRFASTCLRL